MFSRLGTSIKAHQYQGICALYRSDRKRPDGEKR
jgi:hypothetical protein